MSPQSHTQSPPAHVLEPMASKSFVYIQHNRDNHFEGTHSGHQNDQIWVVFCILKIPFFFLSFMKEEVREIWNIHNWFSTTIDRENSDGWTKIYPND